MVKEIDLGKEMDKVVPGVRVDCGDEFEEVSGDGWDL